MTDLLARFERLDSHADGDNEIVRYRLDNGLEVILWQDHTLSLIHI